MTKRPQEPADQPAGSTPSPSVAVAFTLILAGLWALSALIVFRP